MTNHIEHYRWKRLYELFEEFLFIAKKLNLLDNYHIQGSDKESKLKIELNLLNCNQDKKLINNI